MRSGALNRSNFYPRPPQGGRPTLYDGNSAPEAISIHALRKEGDHVSFGMLRPQTQISIHALRKEGDSFVSYTLFSRSISIHALRKEGDILPASIALQLSYFYPRPPQGGRRVS